MLFYLISRDSLRLIDPPGPKSVSASSFPVMNFIMCFIQYIPVLYMTYRIISSNGSTESPTNLRHSIPVTLSKKTLLAFGVLQSTIFWMEPSIWSRLFSNSSSCVVPPWWWHPKSLSFDLVPQLSILNGWASMMDLAQWTGGLGIYWIFLFMRLEYQRCADEWVFLTVSEVQSTFGFR